MDNVIELTRLWNIIKRSFVWMIVLGIIGGVAAYGVAKFALTPKYASSVALLVNRNSDSTANTGAEYANQQADVQMINTYKDIITKPVILKQVAKNLTSPQKVLVKKAVPAKTERKWNTNKLRYETVTVKKAKPAKYKLVPAKYTSIDEDRLADEIAITNETNSQVFTVTVTDTSATRAKNIANEIATVFKKDIVEMMSVKNVSVVSKASVDDTPVSPKTRIIALAGFVLGVLIAFVWGTIRELTDRAVKSIDFLTDELGLVNLGVVSFVYKMHKRSHETSGVKPATSKVEDGLSRISRRSKRV
ncbi:YveK family protein [Lacticaseibacillus hulanensis]|uniref:YveK family protein n=1 Tax=Lacticaseibacillus hulanensis TaxID=2493111 RepID=UPI000FD9C156|nr:Wzz/FepE/Etk N-terminal domain-containing protein [Lacticaseibacillus hulanensis]